MRFNALYPFSLVVLGALVVLALGPFFPDLVGALETEGALLGRWLTLGDSLGSSEGEHGGVLEGILRVLEAALKEGKAKDKIEGEVDGLVVALGTDEGEALGVKDDDDTADGTVVIKIGGAQHLQMQIRIHQASHLCTAASCTKMCVTV